MGPLFTLIDHLLTGHGPLARLIDRMFWTGFCAGAAAGIAAGLLALLYVVVRRK